MKKVIVVGAGFSGLISAYYLQKRGYAVDVYEKSNQCGGLIQTIQTEYGLVETAANGFLDSTELRNVARDIGVELMTPQKKSRKRFFFRNQKIHQWPLTMGETLFVVISLIKNFFKKSLKPHLYESVQSWGGRVFGKALTEYVLIPALGGIYAGNPQKLSASLILLKRKKDSSNRQKMQTVSPTNGMGEFIQKLESYLRTQGVQFHLNQKYEWNDSQTNTLVWATSFQGLCESNHPLAVNAKELDKVSLVTVTQFYNVNPKQPQGFGVLFPPCEKTQARGVLFNSTIFANRSSLRSETWILGGALHSEHVDWSDEKILNAIQQDRHNICPDQLEPVFSRVQRWKSAIPHYTIDLEKFLESAQSQNQFFWVGNYTAGIGLSKILLNAKEMAEQV